MIPLVIAEETMQQVRKNAGETPIFSLLPFQAMKAVIITTGSEVYYERIQDQVYTNRAKEAEEYGVEVIGHSICNDDPAMVTNAINEWVEQGAQMIVVPEV